MTLVKVHDIKETAIHWNKKGYWEVPSVVEFESGEMGCADIPVDGDEALEFMKEYFSEENEPLELVM